MIDIEKALEAYWDAAYREGKEGRTTDDGSAQAALNVIHAKIKEFVEFQAGAEQLIDLLIETVPEARPIILKFVEEVLTKKPR